ncbi:MAG: type I-U CRISPR-associated helicase/endonuclease Cas3 [Myxococcota bacterium]|nr:type I-U CRISPR-associated helicase/endonuclease Cas3 [Myxococcota bacterium]
MAFDDDFTLLTDNPPFPWQRALYERFLANDFPKACDLPTGLGKTSVIALWLLALARNPKLPRRLVYVVNRRTVVDQSTAVAERLRSQLLEPAARHIHDALDALATVAAKHPLAISTLRGEFADNGAWRRDPSRPAIIVGTVDMVGSRLLFSGYGCGFRSRPLHAGFLGQDALVVHDEAHLEPAFQALLAAIADEQRRCNEPRLLKVVALSATGRTEPDFTLGDEDLDNAVVKKRLYARKGLELHLIDDRKELPERIAIKAAELDGKVVVFLSSVDHVEKCAQALRKARKHSVATLTGTMRGAERDELVKAPVFARFLPRPGEGVRLQEGTVFLVATSAGEVGIDLSADHLVTDLPPFDALAQRLGRVNRYGEGDAEVHVYCEKLKEPPKAKADGDDNDEEDDKPGKRKDEYDYARSLTRALLGELPLRSDERRDASPSALRALPRDARLNASTPQPDIHHVDALLFDRWSYTTITNPLPGRPPVEEWLHGKAEWEPPRTTVAWRREVAWLTEEHLGRETLDDFLADYPLRSRETLSDVTSRVLKHLEKLATRDKDGAQFAWLVRHDRPAEIRKLVELVDRYDSKKNPTLDDATVVLAPEAGGLSEGLLDGAAEFDPAVSYDLGPKDAERLVHESEEEPKAPTGMRLVRAVRREVEEDDVLLWWHLFATSQRADDDGSRNSRKELLLDVHLQRTEMWAARLAQRLALPEPEQKALACAGRAHDLGKQRRVWQRSIKRFKEPPLAKGPMQPSELGHYRHELGSLHDGDFSGLSEEAKDLARHAVAAHHGRARPHFPVVESFDPEVKDEVVAALVREVPLRFDRLQHRYGRWGLAWLESILRAADVLGSEEEEVAE